MRQIKLGTEAAANEAKSRELADMLRDALPDNLGFTLFIFDQGKESSDVDPTRVTYISTADRAGMIETIQAWIKKAAP